MSQRRRKYAGGVLLAVSVLASACSSSSPKEAERSPRPPLPLPTAARPKARRWWSSRRRSRTAGTRCPSPRCATRSAPCRRWWPGRCSLSTPRCTTHGPRMSPPPRARSREDPRPDGERRGPGEGRQRRRLLGHQRPVPRLRQGHQGAGRATQRARRRAEPQPRRWFARGRWPGGRQGGDRVASERRLQRGQRLRRARRQYLWRLEARRRPRPQQLDPVHGAHRQGARREGRADCRPEQARVLRAAKFITPHWGQTKPFALASGNQVRPVPPPQFGNTDPYTDGKGK